jgi:OOP family OmpA-OmpF porin
MKLIKQSMVVVAVFATMLFGGKNVVPAQSPVAPVPVSNKISNFYAGLGLVGARFFKECSKECEYEDITYGLMLRAGYDFNDYFGIELRGIYTNWAKGPYGGSPLRHIGIFAKPQLPLGKKANLYGLLGFGYTKNGGNGNRLKRFDNDTGLSAGIGFEIALGNDKVSLRENRWNLFVDYQRLLIKSNIADLDVVSVGLRHNF